MAGEKAQIEEGLLEKLGPADPLVSEEIVRVNSTRMDSHEEDPNKFFRRQSVKIQHQVTGKWVIRHAVGPNRYSFVPNLNQVAIDYDGYVALSAGEDGDEEKGPVTVTPARYTEIISYYLTHPQASLRVAIHLAVLSIILGLLGFATGVASLVLTFF